MYPPIDVELSPDENLVAACETLLHTLASHDDEQIRRAAACALAEFGTSTALDKALLLMKNERSPMIRGDVASSILVALVRQVELPPNLYLSYCGWEALFPEDTDRTRTEDAIVKQFVEDSGEWEVEVYDRIPWVPFSGKACTMRVTVRECIASGLPYVCHANERLKEVIKKAQSHGNPEVEAYSFKVFEILNEIEQRPPYQNKVNSKKKMPNIGNIVPNADL